MEFWFCEKCGKRVTGEDLKAGAMRGEDGKAYCQSCAGPAPAEIPVPDPPAAVPLPRVPAAQTAVMQKSVSTSRMLSAERIAPVPRRGESGTFRSAARGGEYTPSGRQRGNDDAPGVRKNSNTTLLAGSIGAAFVLVLVIVFALSGSNSTPKTADSESTATAAARAPAPAAAPAPLAPLAPPAQDAPPTKPPRSEPVPDPSAIARMGDGASDETRKETEAEDAFARLRTKLKGLSDDGDKTAALDEFIKQYPGCIITARARRMREAIVKPPENPPAAAPASRTESAQAVIGRAEAKRKQNDFTGAIAEVTAAIDGGVREPALFQYRADMERLTGDFEACLADITHALELADNNDIGWILRAVACYGLRQDDACQKCLEKAAARGTRDAATLEKLNEAQFKRARMICDGKTFETKPPSSGADFRDRGAYRFARGNREGALADLQEALKRDPSLAAAGLASELAELYRADKKFDAVLQCYKQWAESKPEIAVALNAYAWELLTSPDPKLVDARAALPLAEKAVQLSDNKDPSILDTLSLAYSKNNRYRAALSTEEKALKLLPANVPAEVRQQYEQRLSELKAIEGKTDEIGVGRP